MLHYLVLLCVFLYLVTARYYSPNNLSLLPADTQHNNTKPALIMSSKFCSTVTHYPVTLIGLVISVVNILRLFFFMTNNYFGMLKTLL